jgi:hypothetical protein
MIKSLARSAVWLLDELLDRVPGYWEGKWHLAGQWGCRMHLSRFWATDEDRPGAE